MEKFKRDKETIIKLDFFRTGILKINGRRKKIKL